MNINRKQGMAIIISMITITAIGIITIHQSPTTNDSNNTTSTVENTLLSPKQEPLETLSTCGGNLYYQGTPILAEGKDKAKPVGKPLHTISVELDYGIEIHWNETNALEDIIRVSIALDYNVSAFYIRNQFRYKVQITASIDHNITCQFALSADVSQHEFPSKPIIPPFEIWGNVTNESRNFTSWLNESTMFDYAIDGYITPRLVLWIPTEVGYYTRFTISHAYIEVYRATEQ